MKRIPSAILVTLAFSVFLSSCATAPKAPLASDELRLLNLDIPQNGTLSANVEYLITIPFEAAGRPEVKRVCFGFSNDRGYCYSVEPKEVTYGSPGNLRIPIHVPIGSNRLDVYAEYTRNGRTERTNVVSAYVTGYEIAF